MRISDIINKNSVEVGAEFFSKEDALRRLAVLHRQQGNIRNLNRFMNDIRQREQEYSGAVSGRIAITALSDNTARDSRITAVTVPEGVEYGAPDQRKVKLIFLIAGRNNSDEYIALRVRLMRLLMDSSFTARLCAAKSNEEFIELLAQRERIRFSPPEPRKEYDCSKYLVNCRKKKSKISYRILDIIKRK